MIRKASCLIPPICRCSFTVPCDIFYKLFLYRLIIYPFVSLLALLFKSFGFFTVCNFFYVALINPFFRKTASTAYVSIHRNTRENGYSCHHIVPRAICTRISIYAYDICRLAFWTNFCILHVKFPLIIIFGSSAKQKCLH